MSLITPRKGYKLVPWLFGKKIEIPEEWDIKRLDEIGEIIGGGTPDSTNKDYWNGEILWAVPTDITKLQINQIENTERKITKLGLENSSTKLLPIETILITSRATVGECAINTKPITTNQGFQNIICNDKYHNYFIFYLIKQFSNNLLRLSHGTTFLEISKNQIKKVIIPISNSVIEQQKIATIFSNIDELIFNTNKIISKTTSLKKGLMQRLLTRGIGHNKFKKVRDRFRNQFEIPESWEYIKIQKLVNEKKILDIQDGNHGELHPKSSDFTDNGIPFITADCLIQNQINYSKCKSLPEKFLKTLRIGFAKQNDVILSHKGSIGNVAIVENNLKTIILSPQTTYYRLSKEILPNFLYYVFQSHDFQKQFKSFAKQSTRDYVGITNQQNLFIPYVQSIKEQQKIASILSGVDSQIVSQTQYKEKLERLKKSLMQKLLTGQVRVTV